MVEGSSKTRPRWWFALLVVGFLLLVDLFLGIGTVGLRLLLQIEGAFHHTWWHVGLAAVNRSVEVAVLLWLLRWGQHPFKRTLNLTPARPSSFVALIVATAALGPWESWIYALCGADPQQAGAAPAGASALAIAVGGVIVAPLVEECLFRGYLLNALRQLGSVAAVVLSAGLFALVHFNLVAPLEWTAHLPAGLLWGIVVIRTGSVWPSIVAHALWNLCSYAGISPVRWFDPTPVALSLSALVMALSVFVLFRRTQQQSCVPVQRSDEGNLE